MREALPNEGALRAAIAAILGHDVADPSAGFPDLGFESLQIIELIVSAEATFGVEFPDEILAPEHLQSPADVWRQASRLAAGSGSA